MSECSVCGNEFSPRTSRNIYCSKECRRIETNKRNRKNMTPERKAKYNATFKHKHPARKMLNSIKSKKLKIDIDEKWIQDRLDVGECEMTGIKFSKYTYGHQKKKGFGGRDPFQPSIDKIDPTLGYTKENCRMVVWIYNLSKSVWTDDIIFEMANSLINKRG